MKRNLTALLLGTSLLLAADLVRPARRQAGPHLLAVLGPARPVLAELLLLRFELNWIRKESLHLLEDARRILALRGDIPALWADLGFRLILDLPAECSDSDLAVAYATEGFEILGEGSELLPQSSLLRRALGECLELTAEAHPERAARLFPRRDPLREALDHYWSALRLAEMGSLDRDLARIRLRTLIASLGRARSGGPHEPELVRMAAELYALPDTTPASRAELAEVFPGLAGH